MKHEEVIELFKYMVSHNEHHTAELEEANEQVKGEANSKVKEAIEFYVKGNDKLKEALDIIKKG